ncbi:MAG TPA: DUF2950 domain-containing protein [Terriglobia bacterium]|nr:DUF2950 domain-containing protein [Terriglobia bacterium]
MTRNGRSRSLRLEDGFIRVVYSGALTLLCLLALTVRGGASGAPLNTARTFATPQAAANALVAAAEKADLTALEKILGPGGKDIVHTGEPARDRETAQKFAEQARTKVEVSVDPKAKNRAFISVGPDHWPFPVPIVKSSAGWAFDSKAGLHEILLRRIGRNELDAIAICRGLVEAQNEYALTRHGNPPVNQYAQKIVGTPGTDDGLAWQNADGTWGGPIGENVARAIQRGYKRGESYHGYFFRILKGQGPDAPMGEMNYVINGAMIGGFALIAFPAQYQVTGVKTFIVSNDGVVYEKDLGPTTVATARRINRFNPDETWTPVDEE